MFLVIYTQDEKPADLDLQCFQNEDKSVFSKTRVSNDDLCQMKYTYFEQKNCLLVSIHSVLLFICCMIYKNDRVHIWFTNLNIIMGESFQDYS